MDRGHLPRVKLYSPREGSFPIPLKYIDVTRTTHTNLDVKQEKRIDDYWNIDGSRDLSDPWTGFTQFTLLEEKPLDGYMWSGWRLTRKQLTSRPDHLWPELWKSMGKNAKLKEKQKWSEEKIHLENARKLRGIYFIDPEDKEFKETIKNARKKLESLWRKKGEERSKATRGRGQREEHRRSGATMKRTEKSKANSRQKGKANSRQDKSRANGRQKKSMTNGRQSEPKDCKPRQGEVRGETQYKEKVQLASPRCPAGAIRAEAWRNDHNPSQPSTSTRKP